MAYYAPLPASAYYSLAQFMPLTGNIIPNDIEFKYCWYRAIRQIATGSAGPGVTMEVDYPRGNKFLYSGTITGLVINSNGSTATLTDAGANFPQPATSSIQRCGIDQPYGTLMVHIWYRDCPRYVAKAGLMDSPSPTTLTLSAIGQVSQFAGCPADWVARGICPSLSSLIGCYYRIYAGDDISPYDRWADPPNSPEFIGNKILAASGYGGSPAIIPTAVVTIPNTVTAGSFTIGVNANGSTGTTASIAFNPSPIDVQNAISALSAVGSSNVIGVNYNGSIALAFDPNIQPVTISIESQNLSGGSVVSSTVSNILLDITQKFPTNQWITGQPDFPGAPTSFDLMTYDNGTHGDKLVRRLTISANGATDIKFGSSAGWKPSLLFLYSIVGHGGWWSPLNRSFPRFLFYSGNTDNRYSFTHQPDDSIAPFDVPALDVSFDPGDAPPGTGAVCMGPESFIAINGDVWNDCCDKWCCSEPDKAHTPGVFKSDKQLFISLMQMCTYPWVDPGWPSSAPHSYPPAMTFPVAMTGAGVNSFTFTVGSVSGGKTYIGVTPPYPEAIVYFTLFNADGSESGNGSATVEVDGTGGFIYGDFGSSDAGKTAKATWAVNCPAYYAFKYAQRKVTWICSLDEFGNPITTPQVSGGPNPIPDYGQHQTVQTFNTSNATANVTIVQNTSCLLAFGYITSDVDPGSSAITDSQGQSWNYVGYKSAGSSPLGTVACWYLNKARVGLTTVSFSPTPGRQSGITLSLLEITGGSGATPIDVFDAETNNGAMQANALTTTATNDYLVSFGVFCQSVSGVTAGAGYTLIDSSTGYNSSNQSSGTVIMGYGIEGKKAPAIGTFSTQIGLANGQQNAVFAVAIRRGLQTAYLGYYKDTPKSTKYVRYDNDYGRPYENGPAFAANDLAEFAADNASDPTLYGFVAGNDNPTMPFQDYHFVGVNGANPPNPVFIGKKLDPISGLYLETGVDAQGTGTSMMAGRVTSYGNTSGKTTQISFAPTVASNMMQRWYSSPSDVSQTLTGTLTGGSSHTLVNSSVDFTTKVWGLTAVVKHVDTTVTPNIITYTNCVINGAGLVAHTLNFKVNGFIPAAGDTYSIVVPGCVMYVHSMIVASGSATTLTATDSPGDVRLQPGYYDKGFTIRLFHDNGDGSQTLYKTFITATNQSTGVFTTTGPDTVSVTAGDLATIDWAKCEVNTMQDWTATITAPGGFNFSGAQSVTVPIIGNDQNTLFFNSSSSALALTDAMLAAGVTCKINTFFPGSVLQRNSTNDDWKKPTGTDNRLDPFTAHHGLFKSDPRYNEPFHWNWFGFIHVRTIQNTAMWNQLWALAKQFTTQTIGVNFTDRVVPSMPENNRLFASLFSSTCTGYTWISGSTTTGVFTDPGSMLGAAQGDILADLGARTPIPPPSHASGVVGMAFSSDNTGNGFPPVKGTNLSAGQGAAPGYPTQGGIAGDFLNNGIVASIFAYGTVMGLVNPFSTKSVDFYDYGDTYNGQPRQDWTFETEDFGYDSSVGEDYYAIQGISNQFDNSGDPVLYHEWMMWSSTGVDSTGYGISSRLGSPATGNFPSMQFQTQGDYYGSSSTARSGYAVIGVLGIIHFSFPAVG